MQKRDYQKLSQEELIKILEEQDNELASKKYGLVWDKEKEPEKVVLDCKNHLPILKRLEDKAIRTDEQEDNILIEGDNYHALTVLNYTHKNKVDVIYIDPPYNTGNKDFVYNDRYIDREDGYRHSKWLSFMEKRLNLAKELLKESGVIFISIDDNEMAQLKLLCDRIFGEENFISNFIWESKLTGGHDSKNVNNIHEYIFCYSKSYFPDDVLNKKLSNKNYSEFDQQTGRYFKWDSLWTVSHGYTKNCDYSIKAPDGKDIFPWMCHKDFEEVKGVARWFWSKETYEKNKESISVKKDKKGNWKVYKKVFAGTKIPYKSILEKGIVGGTSHGKEVLQSLFGKLKVFDNPKSLFLIKEILKIGSSKKSLILDFMAGSGTTGHAVLELNKEDGGNRKFILCTNNDLNGVGSDLAKEKRPKGMSKEEFGKWSQQFGICRRVCYPRLEKTIKGYKKNGNGEKVEGLGGNLQYFEASLVKQDKNRDQMRFDLTDKCTGMLCVKENIFNLEKEEKDFKVFSSNKKDKFLFVYYNFVEDSFFDFLEELKKTDKKKIVYMFSEDNKVDKSLFSGISNFKIEAIPQKILDVYTQLVRLSIKG